MWGLMPTVQTKDVTGQMYFANFFHIQDLIEYVGAHDTVELHLKWAILISQIQADNTRQ